MSDPPSSLEFKAAALTADDAVQGVEAGEFSAKGGNGDLVYSLIDDDNGRFEVKGTLLTIKAPSLGEGGFVVTARVEDQEGRFLEKDFELTVAPSNKGNEPEDPNEPEIPDAPEIPGGPEQPGEPEDPDEPDAPEVPVGPEQPVGPVEPEDPDEPKAPEVPVGPEQPVGPVEPEDPDAPEVPVGPEQPVGPVEPGDPDAPEVPVGPEQPIGPVEPEDPDAPEVPDTPGTPSQPGTPGQPGTPDTPDTPDTPSVPAKPARATGLASTSGMGLVYLSWTAAARAASYEVYYSTGSNFAAATKFAVEPAKPTVTVTGLGFGAVYNFWVVAKNAGGAAAESRPHTAAKTSDDIPAYLKVNLVPGGPKEVYVATNLGWPAGDYYQVQDLGEQYPPNERYYFGYGGLSNLYPPGVIKFVRQFSNTDDPRVGHLAGGGLLENADWDINRGVIIYEYTDKTGQKKYQATYYLDEHVEPHSHSAGGYNSPCHAPEAVMGQANGYTSGLGNEAVSDSLQGCVDTFAKIGTPGQRGGRISYFTMMRIYYAYQDPSLYPSNSMLGDFVP
jgi:hypothetical protein